MPLHSDSPELSIIVPVRNEAANLPRLLANLASQQGVGFELVVCDGDSNDTTAELVKNLQESTPFPLILCSAEANRGSQLNKAVAASRGRMLLLLHADSEFSDPHALRQGLDTLANMGGGDCAGHFRLRFRRHDNTPSCSYFFYESKALLDRPGCTHGDQGLLFSRRYFASCGPFATDLPMLAETRFADRLRSEHGWLLLPAEIITSARRFEQEGLKERQTLNALISNAAAIGWQDFFTRLPGLYRHQDESERLDLAPLCKEIDRLIKGMSGGERLSFWYRTGSYVRSNAWQLAYLLDVRRSFRQHLSPAEVRPIWLKRYDCWLDRLIDHPPGRLLAGLLTRCWFYGLLARLDRK